jgi:hypothetical protein
MKMRILSIGLLAVLTTASTAQLLLAGAPPGPRPAAWWTFDDVRDNCVADLSGSVRDLLSGNFRLVRGVRGQAVKFDGYTTFVRRESRSAPRAENGLTVEAWVALAAFPWNFCPVVVQTNDKSEGFALEIGPRGEVAWRISTGSDRHECLASGNIPVRSWVHLAGIYRKGEGLTLFVNGREAGRTAFTEAASFATASDLLIGTVPEVRKPAAIHREYGTLPSWFSLDAILDDVKVFTQAFSADEVRQEFESAGTPGPPDIPARVLPGGSAVPGHFGAVSTKLSYYWEWDDLWRVADDPDVVVYFDGSPVKMIFWRGTRFSPAWVTENNLWMADQSVEAWDDKEGCFEHMQDPHCLYSHVRIIENTEARIVVHWRYAPVSAHNHLWNVDPRTGWALWVDEYYYIYPDRTAVRHVTWQKGTLGEPHQFQESVPLTSPGQLQGDVVNPDYVTVANLAGDRQVFAYVSNPPKKTTKRIPVEPTIQMHNLRAANKPFIIFEPGSRMDYLRDMNIENLAKPGSCVHWPEGQVPCDGRTGLTADRATSFLGFPITDPVIHQGTGSRSWVNSLYGMTDRPFDEVLPLARSWSKAPAIKVVSGGVLSEGYDMSQRAYVLKATSSWKPVPVELEISASADSPIDNFCLVVKDWAGTGAFVSLDRRSLTRADGLRMGRRFTLSGIDLVVWIENKSAQSIRVVLTPVGS